MKVHNRFMAICQIAVFVCITTSAVCVAAGFIDGVVATVGRNPILHSDVMQEMMPMFQALNAESIAPEEKEARFNELFKQALEQVIEYHILHLEAVAFEIDIPDADVEKRIAEIKKQYDSTEAFQKALEESGHNISDFRERLRRQMMAISVSRSKRAQFEEEVVISESDIDEFYQAHIDEFNYPARYRVRRIFVQAGADPEERKAATDKLLMLREKLVAGEDFGEAAKTQSNGPEAAEGGLLGWVLPGDLVEPLNSALAALAPGEISTVIETEYGLHLLKLEETESAGSLSLQEARGRIEPILRKQRGEDRYRQWMNSLRRRNNVRVML